MSARRSVMVNHRDGRGAHAIGDPECETCAAYAAGVPDRSGLLDDGPDEREVAAPGCRTCVLKGADVSWGSDAGGRMHADVSAMCNHPDAIGLYIHGSEDVAPEGCPLRKGPLLVRLKQ